MGGVLGLCMSIELLRCDPHSLQDSLVRCFYLFRKAVVNLWRFVAFDVSCSSTTETMHAYMCLRRWWQGY